MKYSDITPAMYNEIVEAIEEKLLKLGICTKITMSASTIYDGREMISIASRPFNTMPVIYKAITINGSGFIKSTEHENVYELRLSVSYKFDYFSGGENGVDIGIITFRLFKDSDRVANLGMKI